MGLIIAFAQCHHNFLVPSPPLLCRAHFFSFVVPLVAFWPYVVGLIGNHEDEWMELTGLLSNLKRSR